MFYCPKCGAPMQTYITYNAGQPVVIYNCLICHYNSSFTKTYTSNKTEVYDEFSR